MDLILEAGAEDMKSSDNNYEITTAVQDLESVKKALDQKGITPQVAELTMLPTSTIKITTSDTAKQILSLVETLEEHDDVQHVYSNFDIPDEILEKSSAS